MYLIINTIEDGMFTLALTDADGIFIRSIVKKGKLIQAEKLLPTIDQLIKPKYEYSQIKGIVVSRGPGGFTSIRLGIITANTFSYALDIPIIGLKSDEYSDFRDLSKKGIAKLKTSGQKQIVLPFYGSEPNITKSNKNKLSF